MTAPTNEHNETKLRNSSQWAAWLYFYTTTWLTAIPLN